MCPYQPMQTFTDLRWGTMMPVAVMVGGAFAQVRGRGSLSVCVVDPARLAQQAPDPEDLPGYLNSLVVVTFTDLTAMRSQQAASAAQLTAVTPQVIQALLDALQERFKELGLQVVQLSIDGMDCI